MAAIDTTLIELVIAQLRLNATVIANIHRDGKNNLCIRPGEINPVGDYFPQITVKVDEGPSEPIFPSSNDTLTIIVWVDEKRQEPYKFLKQLKEVIVTLFNREGSDFNQIDVPTNTGLRTCQFLKRSVTFEHDDEIKKYYCEIIFEVVRSEDESFAADEAGNQVWT